MAMLLKRFETMRHNLAEITLGLKTKAKEEEPHGVGVVVFGER
jgi:hypothetical protein